MSYDEKIIQAFKNVCKKTGEGASPSEVTEEMFKKGWLSQSDTVIDIEKEMQRLRNVEGRL